jgi:hypothetical protein
MSTFANVPVQTDALVNSLRTAMATTGSGGGGGGGGGGMPFLSIDRDTGAVTFGKDKTPVPLKQRWTVPLASLQHGFKVWENGRVTEERMVSMLTAPSLPTPETPYVDFGQNGPRKCTQLDLCSVDEVGLGIRFSSLSVSNDNRIHTLLGEIVTQISAKGPEFPNPVIKIRPGNYLWNGKTVWHFDYELVDWLANDGKTLQSQAMLQVTANGSDGNDNDDADEMPWDEFEEGDGDQAA